MLGAPFWDNHSGARSCLPSHFQNPIPKPVSGGTVGACCELSCRINSKDTSQAFPIARKSSLAFEKFPRCFLFCFIFEQPRAGELGLTVQSWQEQHIPLRKGCFSASTYCSSVVSGEVSPKSGTPQRPGDLGHPRAGTTEFSLVKDLSKGSAGLGGGGV